MARMQLGCGGWSDELLAICRTGQCAGRIIGSPPKKVSRDTSLKIVDTSSRVTKLKPVL